jgi:hypothetical protein
MIVRYGGAQVITNRSILTIQIILTKAHLNQFS